MSFEVILFLFSPLKLEIFMILYWLNKLWACLYNVMHGIDPTLTQKTMRDYIKILFIIYSLKDYIKILFLMYFLNSRLCFMKKKEFKNINID